MKQSSLHTTTTTQTYASVILPLPLPKMFTYYVPEEEIQNVKFGIRVEVQFGRNKHYTALVVEVHNKAPEQYKAKAILGVLDEQAIITKEQFQLWKWIASYYCCTIGEVMNAALPANLKLSSETILTLSPIAGDDFSNLNDKEYLIAEALTIQNELPIEEVRKILNQKNVYPVIKKLIEKQIIYLKEDLKEKYKPKQIYCVRLQEPYRSEPDTLIEAFDKVNKANRQLESLMAFLQMQKDGLDPIKRTALIKKAKVDSSVIHAMVKKGIFELYQKEISRIGSYEKDLEQITDLSDQQVKAIEEIDYFFEEKNVVLLHGVTGSGKTRIYIEYIRKALEKGEQVLYLLPEIALTAQLIQRLQRFFGDDVAVYHSKLNNNERVELWNKVYDKHPLVLGPRSALFLPFQNLGLVVIDEEHDPSFKQMEPNPRYQGRDTGIYLAHLHKAKTILGTATPAIESYLNGKKGKYGLVSMKERFGGVELPEIIVADLKADLKERNKQQHFSKLLLEEIGEALKRQEQVILFQNRRGFAPIYRCNTCSWHSECKHCDVSLTYHKSFNALKCHYCGFQAQIPDECPACGNKTLVLYGLGTEKIEDELKIYFPDATIARMDLDTVRGKNAHAQIIGSFEEGRIDILVGTQMVSKGLDFDNVGLVGVLSADQILSFPDFRAAERGFQLMTQVSGRAGRKNKRGKVIIQALKVNHPIIREVRDNDYFSVFQRELQERQQFHYPPFYKLVKITLKHKKTDVLNQAAHLYGKYLKEHLTMAEYKGPAVPSISRIRTYYLINFLVKMPQKSKNVGAAKKVIMNAMWHVKNTEGYSGVRIAIDVDPY
ncbi:MAG: primosomal protein N' [Bacteroidota bacterium]